MVIEDSAKQAVTQNIQGIMHFLQQHPPFDQMETAHLQSLVENCRLLFYANGTVITQPSDGVARYWYVVKQGHIDITSLGNANEHQELMPGDGFPTTAIIGERPTINTYTAVQDSFCLQLPVAQFKRIVQLSEPLRLYALRGVSSLLGQLNQQVQQQASAALGTQYSLDTTLAELMVHQPITCLPTETLSQAVEKMHQKRVGSIAITDEKMQLLGIFTLRDLRKIFIDPKMNINDPISDWMTPNPYSLLPNASSFDAALLMTQHHIAHMCIAVDGILKGVVSERDLFALQRVDLVHLSRAIRQAASVEVLQGYRPEIVRLVNNMLAHGASADQVLRVITQLNDHSTNRVIELILEEHGDPGIEFSWIAFGSEGRGEQTLLTDQDNGILFQADNAEQAEQHRKLLLPLAHKINQALDKCGLKLCPGNIMASNPKLCLSLAEWKTFFSSIINSTDPINILHATIYFDFRLLWGKDNGFSKLQQMLFDLIADNQIFQKIMARTALDNMPPVNSVRDFFTNTLGLGKNNIDIKTQALTPFVDGARIMALAHRIEHPSTIQRLQSLVKTATIDQQRANAYIEAYNYLQTLRMQQHQRQIHNEQPLTNSIDVTSLNSLDQRILRAALLQAKHMQNALKVHYVF